MVGLSKNKARSAPATPEQHQDVDLQEEGDEAGAEDHQDEQDFVRYSRVSALGCREVGFIGKHGQNS
jgi:hypothetical protein